MTKTVIAIGDTHIGNEGAIMTEEVWIDRDIPSKAKVHQPNLTQKTILKKWEAMCDNYPEPDLLILNGDLVDGRNYKDTGLGCWTTDVNLQAEVLAELVSRLKPRRIIGTTGSPYHSDRNPNMDKIAVEKCGGEFHGGYCVADVNDCRIYAQHKITVSKSTWQYRSTPLGRAIVLANLAGGTYGHLDIILKSHAHYFNYVGFSDQFAMALPCWKAYDPFGDTNIEFVDPAIGYVAFEVEDEGSFTFNYDIMHFLQGD